MTHTTFTKIPRMVFVKKDSVMLKTTGVTATTWVFTMFTYTTVACRDMSSLFSVFVETGRHGLQDEDKHRKHPSGRGNAGGLQHHRILFDKYHPGYFGKRGMRHFHFQRNQVWRPIVNIDKLWTLVSEQNRKNYEDKKDKVPVIDVTRSGFSKVLGKGELPNQPVIVKAKFFSRKAEEKIKQAGGACILTD